MKIEKYLLTILLLLLSVWAGTKDSWAQDSPKGTIVLKTNLQVGEKLTMKITAFSPDDIITADGLLEESIILDGRKYHSYTITKQEITLRGNPSMLYCENNKLVSLKIYDIEEFGILNCNNNALEELEVKNLPNLIWLKATSNKLKALDLSTTPKINRLYVYDNELRGQAMTDMIRSLPTKGASEREQGYFFVLNEFAPTEKNLCLKSDVAIAKEKNWKVYKYLGSNNAYGSFGGENIIENPHIIMTTTKRLGEKLNLSIKGVGDLSIDGIKEPLIADGELHTYTIEKQEIKISGEVQDISCPDNELIRLDVENQKTIQNLRCPNNKIKELKLENNALLVGLECSNNALTQLNLADNYFLQGVDCAHNMIEELDFYAHLSLTFLYCNNNALKKLNLAAAPKAITKLKCGNNQLKELDLSKCLMIDNLECQNNQLTSLSIRENTMLANLNVSGNQLSQLDLSNNHRIKSLECQNNLLTELILAEKNSLKNIVCFNNQIKAISASKLIASLQQMKEEKGNLIFITKEEKEKNVVYTTDVAIAKEKNWEIFEAEIKEDSYTTKPYDGTPNGFEDKALEEIGDFVFYPNPVKNFVQISNLFSNEEVALYTLSGVLCLSGRADVQGTLLFDTTQLPEGVYILRTSERSARLIISRK